MTTKFYICSWSFASGTYIKIYSHLSIVVILNIYILCTKILENMDHILVQRSCTFMRADIIVMALSCAETIHLCIWSLDPYFVGRYSLAVGSWYMDTGHICVIYGWLYMYTIYYGSPMAPYQIGGTIIVSICSNNNCPIEGSRMYTSVPGVYLPLDCAYQLW